MGACGIGGRFKAYDWRQGIEEVQAEAQQEYGYQDGYSGAANCVDFSYAGDKSDLTKKQLDKFINDRMDNLWKRSGEVIKVGTDGYSIISTRIEEPRYCSEDVKYIYKDLKTRKQVSRPAVLVEEIYDNYGGSRLKKVGEGTVAECKALAHDALRRGNYIHTMYIVNNSKVWRCDGDIKEVKKTTRKTDAKHLVLPVYEYEYYGWAPE